jgi:hypothetical protein
MPLLVSPSVIPIDHAKENHHAISFTFSFTAEPSISFPVAGVPLLGVNYQLTLNSLGAASLPVMRSLRFSQSFWSEISAAPADAGSLYILLPASGEVIRINPPAYTSDNAFGIVTGLIPIVSAKDAPINFFKANDGPAGGPANLPAHGVLNATVYDFALPPYMLSGYGVTEV